MSDAFRDFGILPEDAAPPAGIIRANFSVGTVIGQYIGTAFMSSLGLGGAVVGLLAAPFPTNLVVATMPLVLFGGIVWLATRHDYAWIELDGDILRAQHLYTGSIVERNVREIDDLLTLVIQARTLAVVVTEAWLGRIRGVEIRFRDGRTPLRVQRSDPAMRNGKELIQAIIYQMAQKGKVEAEVRDLRGTPIVRRLFWPIPPE